MRPGRTTPHPGRLLVADGAEFDAVSGDQVTSPVTAADQDVLPAVEVVHTQRLEPQHPLLAHLSADRTCMTHIFWLNSCLSYERKLMCTLSFSKRGVKFTHQHSVDSEEGHVSAPVSDTQDVSIFIPERVIIFQHYVTLNEIAIYSTIGCEHMAHIDFWEPNSKTKFRFSKTSKRLKNGENFTLRLLATFTWFFVTKSNFPLHLN